MDLFSLFYFIQGQNFIIMNFMRTFIDIFIYTFLFHFKNHKFAYKIVKNQFWIEEQDGKWKIVEIEFRKLVLINQLKFKFQICLTKSSHAFQSFVSKKVSILAQSR